MLPIQPLGCGRDDFLVLLDTLEVGAATRIDRLLNAVFQMTVGCFDSSVFVSYPRIIAGRLHMVVVT